MNRTKKFMINSFFAAINQLILIVIGFIVPRIMMVYYGSEINGIVTSISQFISYFLLAEVGLNYASIQALYEPIANKDIDKINSILSAINKFYIKSGYIFSGLLFSFAIIYPFLIKTEQISKFEITCLIFILGFNGLIDFFILGKYRAIFTADQKTYIISIAQSIYMAIYTTIIFIAAKIGFNVIIGRTFSVLSILIRLLIIQFFAKKKYLFINLHVSPDNKSLDKRWYAFYLNVLGIIQSSFPIIVISVFCNFINVSIYSIYNSIAIGIQSIFDVLIGNMTAGFGDLIARKEKEKIKDVYSLLEFSYYTFISLLFGVTTIILIPFIKIYTTGVVDANYEQPLLGFLMILNNILYNIKAPQGMMIIAAGKFEETKIQTSIQALIIIILGIVFTYRFGPVGMLIAMCISNIYRDVDLMIYVPKMITEIAVSRSLSNLLIMIVEYLLIVIPFLFIDISATGIFEFIIISTIVTGYALVIVIIISLSFAKRNFYLLSERMRKLLSIKP